MSLEPRYLTRAQAAEIANVSEDLIGKAIRKGSLRAKRTGPEGGGKYLVNVDALDDWFEQLEDA